MRVSLKYVKPFIFKIAFLKSRFCDSHYIIINNVGNIYMCVCVCHCYPAVRTEMAAVELHT